MSTLVALWPLWLYLAGWIAMLRPAFRIALADDDKHNIEMGQVPTPGDRGMAFIMAVTAGAFWPLILPFYGLYRLINPTVRTRAEEHAELEQLRVLARKHHLPMPDDPTEGPTK
jgi:hypothetical protein